MMNFGLLAAEIGSLVCGIPANFNGFRILAALLHGTLVAGVSKTAACNRGRHLYSAGRPSRWALAHMLVTRYISLLTVKVHFACSLLSLLFAIPKCETFLPCSTYTTRMHYLSICFGPASGHPSVHYYGIISKQLNR